MPVSHRKRRATAKDFSGVFEKLRRLRETGGSRAQEYEIQEPEPIYIEVNEDEYQKHLRESEQDNFIEDDDGKANLFAEDDLGKAYSDESDYDNSPMDGKRKRSKELEDEADVVRPNARLNSFFQRAAATQFSKPKTTKPTADETAFLSNLLKDLDDDTEDQDLTINQMGVIMMDLENDKCQNNLACAENVKNHYTDYAHLNDSASTLLEVSNSENNVSANDKQVDKEFDHDNGCRILWTDSYEKQGNEHLFDDTEYQDLAVDQMDVMMMDFENDNYQNNLDLENDKYQTNLDLENNKYQKNSDLENEKYQKNLVCAEN
ncbi:24146_t:CDS:2, partial [Racocetra persica]